MFLTGLGLKPIISAISVSTRQDVDQITKNISKDGFHIYIYMAEWNEFYKSCIPDPENMAELLYNSYAGESYIMNDFINRILALKIF